MDEGSVADRRDGTGESRLRYDVVDAVATITLDRPEALNALDIPMKQALQAAIGQAGDDPSVRVLVITGSGRAFCAGQDLRERLAPDAVPLEVEIRERYNPIARGLRTLEKPVIGAINGIAAGAGASLAIACDLRIAAEEASFLLAFGRVGLIPDSGVTWLLPRIVGAGRAMELALATEPLSALDAERIGLVNRVVPGATLLEETMVLARRLASAAPLATGLTKRALNHAAEIGFDDALELEATLQGVAGHSADHAEGVASFIQKRPPRFRGA